jgi:hypothetical protein
LPGQVKGPACFTKDLPLSIKERYPLDLFQGKDTRHAEVFLQAKAVFEVEDGREHTAE